MAKAFGAAERRILAMFNPGTRFIHNEMEYVVSLSGKPTCGKGEPKTDIYVKASNSDGKVKEFKISFKKKNADFLENKTNASRAEQLFGNNWSSIITCATTSIRDSFLSRPLIYKSKLSRTDAGAITLGWKFELLKVKSGLLSDVIHLSREQIIDVYAGTNLDVDKRNALVNGNVILDSGISNYILFENKAFKNVQQVAESLITVEDYVDLEPKVYFACKALNYRTLEKKYDGNRPLAVYVDWHVLDEKLSYEICFDTPLMQGGDYVFRKLKVALDTLGVETTKDLNPCNVLDVDIIYEKPTS